jgi:hypothetical protein
VSSNLTLSAKIARMAELGIRNGLRSRKIIGSTPITGTNVLFSLFWKSPKIFLREIFWYIGKIVVYLTYKVDWETK